jgi:hypothetical protein
LAQEYEQAFEEERLAELIMDTVRGFIPSSYFGESIVRRNLSEEMIEALVQLQTMVSFF